MKKTLFYLFLLASSALYSQVFYSGRNYFQIGYSFINSLRPLHYPTFVDSSLRTGKGSEFAFNWEYALTEKSGFNTHIEFSNYKINNPSNIYKSNKLAIFFLTCPN